MCTGQLYTTETAETFPVVCIPLCSLTCSQRQEKTLLQAGLPTAQEGRAQELHFSCFILLTLPDLETEPASINQGMIKDGHSNFIEIQQQDNHTEEWEKLGKMENSAKLLNTDTQASFTVS